MSHDNSNVTKLKYMCIITCNNQINTSTLIKLSDGQILQPECILSTHDKDLIGELNIYLLLIY